MENIIKLCKDLGVEIKNDNGEYISIYDFIGSLARVYNEVATEIATMENKINSINLGGITMTVRENLLEEILRELASKKKDLVMQRIADRLDVMILRSSTGLDELMILKNEIDNMTTKQFMDMEIPKDKKWLF